MKLEVEYLDKSKVLHYQVHNISKAAFIKHMAMAGLKYAPSSQKLPRMLGMFLHYNQYMRWDDFKKDHFSILQKSISDPTEKGQFSNLAGKAIADFLSKRIDSSYFTVNYEAAMLMVGRKVKGERPDLLAFSPSGLFSIEAKGYSGSHGNMKKHKDQSSKGPIPVSFSVASVAYKLYDKVKVKYHDPVNKEVKIDYELLKLLSKEYYQGLKTFMDEKFFEIYNFDYQGHSFHEVRLSSKTVESLFPNVGEYLVENIYKSIPSLILPTFIDELARNGITLNYQHDYNIENNMDDSLYIDNDWIGIKLY